MNRSYWLKFGGCVVFLLLVGTSTISAEWRSSLGWPWEGLLGIATAAGEVLSPFVFIYLVILAMKLK